MSAGLNFVDALMRADRYAQTPPLPFAPGFEIAGVVDQCGAGVTAARLGARVAVPLFAHGRAGGYAEYVVVPDGQAVSVPDGLQLDDAVALMVQGLSARHALLRCDVAGKVVVISAAAGGVGTLLIQLARSSGARVIVGRSSDPDKLELVRRLGADLALDHRDARWPAIVRHATDGRGADVVIDMVGGSFTRWGIDALGEQGKLLFGALGRVEMDDDTLESAFARNVSVIGFALRPLLKPARLNDELHELFEMATDGRLHVKIGASYPLSRVSDAHRAIDEHKTVGKVVLHP